MNCMFRLLIIFMLPAFAFSQDAAFTIEKLNARMNRINDYSADALIKSDIPLIKIFPVKAIIYFKQKNKFRIKSKGIAILPKQGFFDMSELLVGKDNYTALFSGIENTINLVEAIDEMVFHANEHAGRIGAHRVIEELAEL